MDESEFSGLKFIRILIEIINFLVKSTIILICARIIILIREF